MKRGYLNQYFAGAVAKTLSGVEVDHDKSNQHEFNGTDDLINLLGIAEDRVSLTARFLYLGEHLEEAVEASGQVTWYDARAKARRERGIQRSEHRLYFSDNEVVARAEAGDLLVIARQVAGPLLIIVAGKGTTAERQVRWLLGLSGAGEQGFSGRGSLDSERDAIGLAARMILDQIGIDATPLDDDHLPDMISRYGEGFPSTAEFSEYARSCTPDVDGSTDPDLALIRWMEQEEMLFRSFEKHLVGDRLRQLLDGQRDNIEEIIALVQAALQRRRSRAGFAFENHLEQIFHDQSITCSRGETSEGNRKPDFIFPGIVQYRDPRFPEERLTMLGAKSTCKDRWRQILNEAQRIVLKHLVTLEPGISINQTEEMRDEQVQLVLPRSLHETFSDDQREWLMDVSDFVELVRSRQ